jgi:hypothetical protein
MNFGKGGQNIVRAGNNNPNVFRGAAGNILSTYLGTKLRRSERDYNRQADLESRKEFEDYKNESGLKSRLVEKAVQGPLSSMFWDHAMETYGPEHPDVVSGKRQADEFVRPEFANQVMRYGVVSGKHGVNPAQTPASISQVEAWKRYRDSNPKVDSKKKTTDTKVDTSSAIASSPVGGFNAKEQDIQDSLRTNNAKNIFPFESSVGSSGDWSPTKFDGDQPMFSEIDAEELRADAAKNPFDTKEGYKERTSHLTDGINDGKGGNK